MDSAFRPLVQCQPSITEDTEQLFQLSVINGIPWRATEFGRICRGELRNLAKFSAENCGPYTWMTQDCGIGAAQQN